MIHNSATKDSETVSWGAIERYHTQTNKWSDIGYHYGVERIGSGIFGLVGRSEDISAAACKEGLMNHLAIHVCVVGNFDVEPPQEDVLDTLVKRVLVPIMRRNHIEVKNIVGHRDYATYKSCPGKMWDLDALRGRVRNALG